MVLDSLLATLAGVAGWVAGLTAHMLCRNRWRDLGARVVWYTLAMAVAIPAAAALFIVTLLVRHATWLAVDAAAAALAGRLAWSVSAYSAPSRALASDASRAPSAEGPTNEHRPTAAGASRPRATTTTVAELARDQLPDAGA